MKDYLDNPQENRPKHLFDTLDSTLEQEEADDKELEIPVDETPAEFEEDKQTTKIEGSKFKIPIVDDDETMRKLARSLSTEQRLIFDKLVDYCKKFVSSQKIMTFKD